LKLRAFIPVLIIAAGLWAYHNSFRGPFILDDVRSIAENPHIHHLWSLREAMFVSPHMAVQGRPVESVTLAMNYALDGLNVRGYHVFNLAVHVLSALVLFGILRRTLTPALHRSAATLSTAATWLAAAITLIWEVHPLQTESVTYIVQRSELLMGLFLLLTLYCTLRGSQSSWPWVWYLAAVVSCALGMGSKEVMVAAPLIVLLYDRVFLAASFRQLWRRRMGLYVGLAGTWVLLAALVGRTVHPATRFDIQGLTPWDYLMTEAGVIVHYLRLCFWPHPLVIDYGDWPIALSLKDAIVPGVAVLGLLGATVWALRYRPWAGFIGAWFFLILGPTSSVLPSAGEVAAERRMYLPLAAVVTLTAVSASALGKRLLAKREGAVLGCVGSAAVVAVFGLLTIHRNEDYRSALAIWQDTVDKRPDNARAQIGLGNVLFQAGSVREAIGHYEQALRIRPDFAEAHNNLGFALFQAGKVREAIGEYELALRLKPDMADAHYNMGNVLLEAGRVREAIDQYERTLRIRPDFADAGNNLAWLLATRAPAQGGDAVRAVELARRACELVDNRDAGYLDTLAAAYAAGGRFNEAVATVEKAIEVAGANGQSKLIPEFEARLRLYRSGRRYLAPEARAGK
jgi:protein O-mannosyl-transferase